MAVEDMVSHGPAFRQSHPGAHLRENILPGLDMSRDEFARHLKIKSDRLDAILDEMAPVTPDVALRLGKALRNGARFWLAWQMQYDVWIAEHETATGVEGLSWRETRLTSGALAPRRAPSTH